MQRAKAVMDVMLEESKRPIDYESELQRYVTANGRSFAELICNDGSVDTVYSTDPIRRCGERGGVDREKSRRIEIRFEYNDAPVRELLRSLKR